MAERDYFVMKLREDGQLLSSFSAFVKEYRLTILESMVGRNDDKDLLRAQGAVRSLDLFETRVKNTVHPKITNNRAEAGNGDQSRTGTN